MKAGDVVAGRFEIERHAGTGGMGDVFRARDRETGQTVALKVLHGPGTKYAARFAREAAVLAELHHPGIVRHIAHGSTETGRLYLAMEWLEGMDLARRLAASPLSVDESITLARRAAEALGAAHDRAIVHRDVKPSNLFLEGGDPDRVRLLDFGIARLMDGTATLTGVTFGTPGYMAPEQARGDRELDARADVFALGCVLFECLTGQAVFAGEHLMAVLAKIVLEDARRVREVRPDIPRELDHLVARMLAKSAPDRPRDGNEVAAELATLSALVGGPPRAITSSEAISITPGEQRLLCVVLAGFVDEEATSVVQAAEARRLDSAALRATIRSPRAALVGGSPVSTAILERVKSAVTLCDVRIECLAEGSVVATLTAGRSATDQASQAARCALVLRAELPDVPVVVTTGRGVLAGRLPVGEAIDRAASLLRAACKAADATASGAPPVRLDEVTAGLLGPRFDVGGDVLGLFLRGERETPEAVRTLLGKPTPFVGRDREMLTLEAAYAECTSEYVARAIIVKGAAGVGKSRLLHEFVRRVRRGDTIALKRDASDSTPPLRGTRRDPMAVEVWTARADALAAGSAFAMVAQAIRRTAGVLDGEPTGVQQQKIRARVGRHVPALDQKRVAEFLGELARVPFPDDDSMQLRAARQDARLMGDQIRRAWEDFVTAECAAQPVLLVLEDLHWGDLPSIQLVDAALRHVRRDPLLVIALARPEIDEVFPKLWVDRDVLELRVPQLTPRASEKLARFVLGPDASEERVTKLVDHADGNALYLEELLRAEVEGRSEEVPGTVLAMVQSRLEGLGAESRWVLRAASIFGDVFWRGGVHALVGGASSGVALDKCLATLVEREVVAAREASKFPNETEYMFRHAFLREAAYSMLTEADCRLGHKLAASWLESVGEPDAMVLAEHFERGREPDRALGWYRRAAEQALEGNDLAAAVARAERGVACGAVGDVLGALRLVESEAHRWRGQHAEAQARALEAMAVLERGSPLWYAAAGELALVAGRTGSQERLVELVDALCAPAADERAHRRRIVALARFAVALLQAGRYALADRVIDQIGEAERTGPALDPAAQAPVHRARASRARIRVGDPAAYLTGIENAAACHEIAGDLRNACNTRVNVGYADMELGLYARAERALWDALAMAERMGLPAIIALAKHNLGFALAREGAFDQARALEAEAVEAFRAQGDRRLEAASRVYLSAILLSAGRLDEAEREADLAIGCAGSVQGLRAHALAQLADVRMAKRDAAKAIEAAQAAMAILDELGALEEGEAFLRVVHAQALDAVGERAAARDAIAIAAKRLRERAGKIAEETLRRSFLERVPENARTLALEASWVGPIAVSS